jgi:hypothetical protein
LLVSWPEFLKRSLLEIRVRLFPCVRLARCLRENVSIHARAQFRLITVLTARLAYGGRNVVFGVNARFATFKMRASYQCLVEVAQL